MHRNETLLEVPLLEGEELWRPLCVCVLVLAQLAIARASLARRHPLVATTLLGSPVLSPESYSLLQ